MAARVQMTSPLGRGTAMVAADRVDRYKANGWREVATEKPKPATRRRKTDDNDDE